MRPWTKAIWAIALAASVSACGGLGADDPLEDNGPPEQIPVVIEDPAPAVETQPEPRWSCSYEPTLNDDWHDDVLCTNGTASDRPYLRAEDSFVTEDEIMESAAEYESELNGE